MRSILESAFYALTNHDKEKSDALFREFMLERSRQIHEAIRVNGDIDINEFLKEDQEPVAVNLFAEDEDQGMDGLVDAAPQSFLIVPNGDSFDVFAMTSEDEAQNAAQVISTMDGGEATVASADALGDILGVDATDIIAGLTQSLTASAITDLYADGIESFDASNVPETVLATSVAGDDSSDFIEDEVDDEEEDEVTSKLGSDLAALVDDFDAAIEKTSLGEAAVDNLKKLDTSHSDFEGVDALGNKVDVNIKTGVADVRNEEAKPVEIKSKNHVGYDREEAPKAASRLVAKNVQLRAEENLEPARAGEPKNAALNTNGGAEKQVGLFDKKI